MRVLRQSVCLLLVFCLMLPLTVFAAGLTAAQRSANRQEIYNFLGSTLKCNKATACGILANLEQESGYDPQASVIDTNKLLSYGLCQWNGPRNTQLRSYCTARLMDYRTVSAQLQFMWYELQNGESNAWQKMQGFPNTAQGACDAAIAWATYFERCASSYRAKRGEVARLLFSEMGEPGSGTPVTPVTPVKPAVPDLLPDSVTYRQGQFGDVAAQWFAPYVEAAVTKGLIVGDELGNFNPYSSVTIAEAVTMACRIHSLYEKDGERFKIIGSWYNTYFTYARRHSLIDDNMYFSVNPNAPATRAQFAVILSESLPESALEKINSVPNGMIPDVDTSIYYAASVYQLYKAGVLTGGENYQFFPNDRIQRSEAAAVLARMVAPAERKSF